MTPRQNIRFRDLTNVLLKPEPRWSIEDGLVVLVCGAMVTLVVLAMVWWG